MTAHDVLRLIGACESGHEWEFSGGANCSCRWRDVSTGDLCHGNCSVPVNRCRVCGDCDYGVNDDASAAREACAGWRSRR